MNNTDEGKVEAWTRWAVVIETADPQTTYTNLYYHFPHTERFAMGPVGLDTGCVKVVVEYTAKGANADDVKRRVASAAGVDKSAVMPRKIGHFFTGVPANADLCSAVGHVEAVAVNG